MAADARPAAVPATTRRALLSLAAVTLLVAARRPRAATLPAPGSLRSALAAALRDRQPLVVLVSADRCPFCMMARDNYLAPLQREGHVRVVQLDLGSRAGLLDFAGNARTQDELLRRWHVDVAPTVLFFGPEGREVAPRLVGLSQDFYGAYLEQRLATARGALTHKSA